MGDGRFYNYDSRVRAPQPLAEEEYLVELDRPTPQESMELSDAIRIIADECINSGVLVVWGGGT